MDRRVFEELDEDRKRLARELHSGPAQDLAVLQLSLSTISNGGEALQTCSAAARSCAKVLRDVMARLHPPLLDEAGLAAAVRYFAETLGAEFSESALGRLPGHLELSAYRLIEELATPKSGIELTRRANDLAISVRDGKEMRASSIARVSALKGNWEQSVNQGHSLLTIVLPVTNAGF